MKTTSIVVFAAAAIAAAFFGAGMMQHESEEAAAAPAAPNLFPFVRSLEGTVPDGTLPEDPTDRLVVGEELVRLFDYYLVAVGEKPLDDIRREIARELDTRLKPNAAREAKAVLGRYLSYKQALLEVEKNPQLTGAGIESMRGRLHAMQQARRQFFSEAEAQAMFGMEDAMHFDAVSRLEISQDKSLSDEQKAQRLAALDAALPAPLREARDATLQVVRLEEATNALRSKGASDDDIYRMRATALSPEAAARLADVDREENEWRQRIAAYRAERMRVLDSVRTLPATDQERALQQLRQARFSDDERLRLPAYE